MVILGRLIRSGFCVTCGAALIAILFLASSAFGDEAPTPVNTLSPEQIKAEVARLEKDVADLYDSADAPSEWKEMRQAVHKYTELYFEWQKLVDPVNERIHALAETAPVRAWEARIEKVRARLNELRNPDEAAARAAGQKLYEARHRELAKRGPTDTPALHRLGFDILTFPRIDGSTSTVPLSVLIACRCFDMPCVWLGREESRALYDEGYGPFNETDLLTRGYVEPEFRLVEYTAQAKGENPARERLAAIVNRLMVATPDTHTAFLNIIEGKSDFGLLARGPSQEELDSARQKGVELRTAPCALDALVFIVNEKNPLASLTTEQIRGIYSGKIARWKEVGGADKPITPYQREEQSGSQQLMRSLVMKDLVFANPAGWTYPRQLIGYLMTSPYSELHSDTNGLAYSVHYYERYMAGSARTRVIAVDGIEPSEESIRTRKYPFVAEVLVVTRKDLDPKAPAARLRDWLLSSEGQAVVRESGYIPLPR